MLQIERKTDPSSHHHLHTDPIGINVYSSKDQQSLHFSLNGEFFLYQILLQQILDEKVLAKFDQSSLVKYFQPEDRHERETMREFDRHYQPSKAMYWYTRQSCIHQILNKALRTQNIDDLIPFGRFIRDLDTQLSEEHQLFIKQSQTSTMEVYRGQYISKDELNRLKTTKGELISMNSFLSTNTNKEKALELITNRSSSSNDLTSILLEIKVDLNASTRSYASIEHLNASSSEEEILFMFGCIFRLDQISYEEEMKLWKANLTLCSKDDEDVKKFSFNLQKQLEGQNQLIALGSYFLQMMKYEEAEEHYENILNNRLAESSIEFAYCYYGLAQVNQKKGDYRATISNLNKVISYLLEDSMYKDHPLVSQCYNDLAKVYFQEKNVILAFQFYEKAFRTINNVPSVTYSGLSQIHCQLGNYNLALDYLQKALDKQSPTAYAFIANTYIDMGKVYAKINDIDQASNMFDKAIECQLKVLTVNHPDLSYTHAAKAMMYSDNDDQDKALEYLEKAYQLQLESLPYNHSDFADTY